MSVPQLKRANTAARLINSSIDYKLIGSRIQKKRKELNLTQEQLSEKLNLTPFYLSRIENGRAAATLETFASIAQHLEMDLAMLLTGTSILEKQYHIDKLNNICAKATNKQLDLIIKLAKGEMPTNLLLSFYLLI